MPEIARMFPKRFLDVMDLPQDGSVVPVTIQQVYLDGFQMGGRGGPQQANPEWRLKFAEFAKPVSLRPKRAKEIAVLLGSENTDSWHGKRIGIHAGWYDAWGENKWGILVSQQPVEQLPNVQPMHQVGSSPAPMQLPAKAQSLGADSAAEICCLLEERGKTWDDLRLHLVTGGFGEHINGKLPPDVPVVIKQTAWSYINSFPKCKEKPTHAKFMAMWAPPAISGEVIDKSTGEVLSLKAGLPGQPPFKVDAEDIPF